MGLSRRLLFSISWCWMIDAEKAANKQSVIRRLQQPRVRLLFSSMISASVVFSIELDASTTPRRHRFQFTHSRVTESRTQKNEEIARLLQRESSLDC